VTFNVLSSEHEDWDRRRRAARSVLREVDPDVVALQETDVAGGQEQVAYLLGGGYQVVEHVARETDAVGSLMASRWPIRAAHHIDLSVVPRVPSAAALLAEVEVPAPFGLVRFVHHGAAYQYGYALEREAQAVSCARAIERLVPDPREHVVLLGDFNDSPDSSSVRFWTGRQSLDGCSVAYRDAWESVHPHSRELTFTPENPLVRDGQMPLEPGRRIDYVMVRCDVYGPTLQVAECELIGDRPIDGVWASDHYGVAAQLRVPTRSAGSWA
jgi:endonuclease/exonuclease/phosphatase family metal-dependent hydrolase